MPVDQLGISPKLPNDSHVEILLITMITVFIKIIILQEFFFLIIIKDLKINQHHDGNGSLVD